MNNATFNQKMNEVITLANNGAVVTGVHVLVGAFTGFVDGVRVKYGNDIQLTVDLDVESRNNTGRDVFLIDGSELVAGQGGVFHTLKIHKNN